jgi:hypothetical protein
MCNPPYPHAMMDFLRRLRKIDFRCTGANRAAACNSTWRSVPHANEVIPHHLYACALHLCTRHGAAAMMDFLGRLTKTASWCTRMQRPRR